MTTNWWGPGKQPKASSTPLAKASNELDNNRSGFARFTTVPALPYTNYATPLKLCTITLDKPEPCTLSVRVAYDTPDASRSAMAPVLLSLFSQTEPVHVINNFLSGMLIIEYGDLNCTRRVAADLRSGTFQLPPCKLVKVYAHCWYPAAGTTLNPAVLVTAAIAPGLTTQPSRLQVTACNSLPAASTSTFGTPDAARWVDIWAELDGSEASPPILCLYASNSTTSPGVPLIKRDYDNDIFTPPWGPVELGSNGLLALTNRGAATVRGWIRFFLEL